MIASYLRPLRDPARVQHLECDRDCREVFNFIIIRYLSFY